MGVNSDFTKIRRYGLLVLWLIAFGPAMAHAQETVPGSLSPAEAPVEQPALKKKNWQFTVDVHGWLAGVQGSTYINGEQSKISIPFEEIFNHTEAGFQCYMEAKWRKWFLGFDGTWATLHAEEKGRFVGLDMKIKQRIYDIRLGYVLLSKDLGELPLSENPRWQRKITIDAFVGGRYWYTKVDVDTTLLWIKTSASSTDERWDPFVGLRASYDLTKRWGIGFRGDVGGFGIGDAAQFTWQASGTVYFKVTPWCAVFGGYRAIATDTVQGSGTAKNGADLLQYGPFFGARFTF